MPFLANKIEIIRLVLCRRYIAWRCLVLSYANALSSYGYGYGDGKTFSMNS